MATNYTTNNISSIKLQNKEYNIKAIPLHGTEEEWLVNSSYIPKDSEIIVYDIDENCSHKRFKIGDGTTTVVNLPFADEYLENQAEELVTWGTW